jgi:hypothetical protein
MSTFVKGGGGAGEKVKIDGVKVANKMELTSYKGANPLTIGQAGVAFPANTLFLEDFDILNGVNGEDLTDTAADQTTAVKELMKMVSRKIAMNNGEGQYVWKKCKEKQVKFTQLTNSANPTVLQAESNTFDLSKVDSSWFAGLKGTYTVDNKAGNWVFTSDTQMRLSDAVDANFTYDPTTAKVSIAYSLSSRVWNESFGENAIVGYVTADSADAYPNGDELDGYWYEMIDNYTGANPLTIGEAGATIPANTLLEEALQILNGVEAGIPIPNGFTKYAVDKIVMSSRKSADSGIPHTLGVVPRLALITRSTSGNMSATDLIYGFAGKMMDNVNNDKSYFLSALNNTNSTENIDCMGLKYSSYVNSSKLSCWGGYLTAGVEYTLITMA